MNPTKTFSISTAADKHWKIKDIVEGQGQLDNDAARGDKERMTWTQSKQTIVHNLQSFKSSSSLARSKIVTENI